ncbi:MAG: DNA polymerase III subunit delta [Gammaproteobacteria bacterium]|nr:MAG: DNA polymerase III subunit delta [Gammaproteobacteria bacterium]
MRLKAEQLTTHGQQGLLPVYVIFGDEAMLVEEAADSIRQLVRKSGAEDRQVWHVEGRFNWSEIQWQEQTMSLFSSQRLLEIRLPSGAPGKEGGEALRKYAANPPADTTVLIISGKIDSRSQKSKWFTELDKIGGMVAIWPIDSANLPRWIRQRMQQRGLTVSQQNAALIAERVEGNLFAASQEIDKLHLLCLDGQVDEDTILSSVADNARFQAFGLMDSVLLGQVDKIPRILGRLRAEGLDILSVFSAVSWSLHRMVDMAMQLESGARIDQVFSSQKPPVWEKTRSMMQQALNRHDSSQWQQFLVKMAKIDQAAKGSLKSDPWTLLEMLCLHVAGVAVLTDN